MKNLTRITLGTFILLYVVVMFQNCSPRSQDISEYPSVGDTISSPEAEFDTDFEKRDLVKQWVTSGSNKKTLSIYDFPGTTLTPAKKAQMVAAMGTGTYTPIRTFYSSMQDVYRDFNLNPQEIQTCDDRNNVFLQGSNSSMRRRARQYFCSGEFATAECRAKAYKKIRLGYCLDSGDSIDWLAIQGAILNAKGRTVVIPPEKLFLINQSVVLPTNARIVWQGKTKSRVDGLVYRADGASFLRWVRRAEPKPPGQMSEEIGFSTGSVLVNGNMPFIYSGENPYRSIGITRNISLYFPMIDGANVPGENGISFAQGMDGALIHGGTIRNIKIDKEIAGGKAVQCEAGCKNLAVKGLEILNSFIGINATSSDKYIAVQKFTSGPISHMTVDGIVMKNVEVPFNFFQNMPASDSQSVTVQNFSVLNSGRMSQGAEIELFSTSFLPINPTILGSSQIVARTRLATAAPPYAFRYGGLVTSRGGKNINIRNGQLINAERYPALDGLVVGFFQNSFIENVRYTLKFDCRPKSNGSIHPSCR